MSDVYVAVYRLFRESGEATNAGHLIGVYSSADAAMEVCDSFFDDEVQWEIVYGPFGVHISGDVEIERTAWATEQGWHKATCRVHQAILDAKILRPLTKAEQERDMAALVIEYGRAVDEYESETHE